MEGAQDHGYRFTARCEHTTLQGKEEVWVCRLRVPAMYDGDGAGGTRPRAFGRNGVDDVEGNVHQLYS